MKRVLWLMLLLLAAVISLAQTQRGIVKTKGRLSNDDKVIPGVRLQGATIQVKGQNAVLSQKNGTFSFVIPSTKNVFFLQKVEKLGYTLTDPDILSNQYTYSSNPIVLVMETPSQKSEDKLAAERTIRRSLRRQIQEKEDEIEILKEQNKLTEEKYRQQLQHL